MALFQIIGRARVGGDPELKFLPNGQAVANFSIIASSSKKEEDGSWTTTAESGWLRATAWGPMAERVANDVTKGCEVMVVGRYKQRKYTTRDGVEGTAIEVDLDAVEVIPPRDAPPPRPAVTSSGTSDPWGTPVADSSEPPFLVMPDRTPFH